MSTVALNITEETFENVKREPLNAPGGRKFQILEASLSILAVDVNAVPDENGELPVHRLYLDGNIVDDRIAFEGVGRDYITVSGSVIDVEREDSLSSDQVITLGLDKPREEI